MNPGGTLEDDWDFYPCRVDDAAASIFLNLALAQALPGLSEDTLYALRLKMVDQGEHRMGSGEEASAIYPVEDAIVDDALALGVRFVGRLRNLGTWQMIFMGPPDLEPEIRRIAATHLEPLARTFSIVTKFDPEWTYYSEFLYPNEERRRWIRDKRVVDVLEQHGDPLTVRRRVDHWIYFQDAESCRAFAAAASAEGFQMVEPEPEAPNLGVQIYRTDSVQLEDIHEVTNLLADLAAQFNGEYDGWETEVEAE